MMLMVPDQVLLCEPFYDATSLKEMFYFIFLDGKKAKED